MNTGIMAPRKNKRNKAGMAIAQAIINEYHGYKATDNRRNGYSHKTVKTTYGDIPVEVPRDRDASFEPSAEKQKP